MMTDAYLDSIKNLLLRRLSMSLTPAAEIKLPAAPLPESELGIACPNCNSRDCQPVTVEDALVCRCPECLAEFSPQHESRARRVVQTVFEARRGLTRRRRRARRASSDETAKLEVMRLLSQ